MYEYVLKYSLFWKHKCYQLVFIHCFRLVGCQGLLEEIPGRRKDSLQLILSSPGESKSLLRGKNRNTSKSYNVKEDLSSKVWMASFIHSYEFDWIIKGCYCLSWIDSVFRVPTLPWKLEKNWKMKKTFPGKIFHQSLEKTWKFLHLVHCGLLLIVSLY